MRAVAEMRTNPDLRTLNSGIALDSGNEGGARPTLTVTPATSVLQAPDGTTVVDLPDGTVAVYEVSPDLLTYTLTLTGPSHGTSVTVSPETGVLPAA
jgi:hypothetical protein